MSNSHFSLLDSPLATKLTDSDSETRDILDRLSKFEEEFLNDKPPSNIISSNRIHQMI